MQELFRLTDGCCRDRNWAHASTECRPRFPEPSCDPGQSDFPSPVLTPGLSLEPSHITLGLNVGTISAH
ncbi:hypothetical protein [Desulfosporosinus lacus]|uniref:hypothetical protein n=1 Tax=Desulfosporosinus lacus TaxID=329936 RepID=UPI0011612BE2|nr:hypothetical protein [Desulfosporosinus lacus]